MKKIFTSVLILFCISIKSQAQTGLHVPELVAFDSAMTALLTNHGVPGGQLALTYQGRLVYNRGFGYSNTSSSTFVQPSSVFRIASLSKPITSVGIMKLFEQGLLTLDSKVFGPTGILNDTTYQNILDSRITDITVRHLLQHQGGWNRNISGDPMFNAYSIASYMGVPPPGDAITMIRYMLANTMLDFDPGTQSQYSNFGYCVLGRVIEKITGESYENYMRGTIFVPMGITEIQLGRNLEADILPNEVTYYDYPGAPMANSVYDNSTQVTWPYAGFNIEYMDAHGGWVSSAEDLCKFLVSVDRFNTKPDILTTATIDTMIKPSSTDPYYACGFSVNAFNNWWHNGSLPGTSTEFVRAGNLQLNWAILLNTRPANSGSLMTDVDNLVWNCLPLISTWPAHDLFTGISESEKSEFAIYPNPVSQNFSLQLSSFMSGNINLKIFDLPGKLVYSTDFTGQHIQVNTNLFENGIYLVQIESGNKKSVKKLIVRH